MSVANIKPQKKPILEFHRVVVPFWELASRKLGKNPLIINFLKIGIQIDVFPSFKENSIIYEAITTIGWSDPFCPWRKMPDLLYLEWLGIHRLEHTRQLVTGRSARRRRQCHHCNRQQYLYTPRQFHDQQPHAHQRYARSRIIYPHCRRDYRNIQ